MYQTELLPKEQKIVVVSILIYVGIYSLEAPLRYALAPIGLTQLILLRDLLIIGPLVYITLRQAAERQVNPVILLFAFLFVVQGLVFYANFHLVSPVLFGAKLLINVALGLMVGALITNASGRPVKVLTMLFVVTCVGLFVEKFVTKFPWVGLTTNIGGIEVPISFDWQAGDGVGARVGGFTRISINAAGLVPFLAFLVVPRVQSFWLRLAILALAIGAEWLTTQKGALIAVVLVAGALLTPAMVRGGMLRLLVLTGAAAQVILPFATAGLPMSEGTGGVFSMSSFAARVLYTWPGALKFVNDHAIGIFGSGIGSLGGPVRLFMPASVEMFADNMFIFIYGYLGIFAALFYWAVIAAVWRSIRLPLKISEAALAMLGFELWYGIVITGVEDQLISLGLGMSLGCLLMVKYTAPALPVIPSPTRTKPRLTSIQEA